MLSRGANIEQNHEHRGIRQYKADIVTSPIDRAQAMDFFAWQRQNTIRDSLSALDREIFSKAVQVCVDEWDPYPNARLTLAMGSQRLVSV